MWFFWYWMKKFNSFCVNSKKTRWILRLDCFWSGFKRSFDSLPSELTIGWCENTKLWWCWVDQKEETFFKWICEIVVNSSMDGGKKKNLTKQSSFMFVDKTVFLVGIGWYTPPIYHTTHTVYADVWLFEYWVHVCLRLFEYLTYFVWCSTRCVNHSLNNYCT